MIKGILVRLTYGEKRTIDATTFIGNEVKSIMQLITDIDPFMPDEDQIEVLIGAMNVWGVIEAQVLFPALEAALEGSEATTEPARQRLNTLYALQGSIHDGEAAEAPFSELAQHYIDGVKFHLVVDVQDMIPLTAQLPTHINAELARSMDAMKLDME